jgi:outer membrane receptor protein involved in Fe transport
MPADFEKLGGQSMTFRTGAASTLLATTAILAPVAPAAAQASAVAAYDLPAQDLETSLRSVARTSGQQIIIASSAVEGRTAPALKGQHSAEQAVRALLVGTVIRVRITPNAILVGDSDQAVAADQAIADGEAITVTGSRIKGVSTASPVITYDAATVRNQGVSDMRALATIIPQNFTGGQNPSVATGAETFGSENGNSSTQLNLRGLGADATLTLLNGHRLVYELNNQGVDISSIPFVAIDRVEIMPDGASALYGSDAVGGVANVILKRDYSGVAANASIAGATDGGYFNRDFSVVAGQKWASGSGLVALGHQENSPIYARQRSYSNTLQPDQTLYPKIRSFRAVGSLSQSIGSATFSLDALYSERKAATNVAYTPTVPANVNGLLSATKANGWTVAPSVNLPIGTWEASLSGMHGESKSTIISTYNVPSTPQTISRASYRNKNDQIEFGAQGPLLSLPAGAMRVALGGGYRRSRLDALRSGVETPGTQESVYAYGEASIPLVGSAQSVPFVSRLSLTIAGRYERYENVGDLITPKVGAIWDPTNDLSLKFSWGRSFKAPRVSQMIQQQQALLLPLSAFGISPGPNGSTVLVAVGGNPELRPEKAESITGTIEIHPRAIPELRIALSYYHINYRNRIIQPLTSIFAALTDPALTDVVTIRPDGTLQGAIVEGAGQLFNLTGVAYEPSAVYALVDGRWTNSNREKAQGVDLSMSYSVGEIALFASGTYIETTRQFTSTAPIGDLAGTLYNPPHVRVRGGLTWSPVDTAVSAVLNFVGPVTDHRFAQEERVRSLVSIDVAATRSFNFGRGLGTLDVQLSVANLFNGKPDKIRSVSPYDVPYDSTNYSSFGRVVSLSITKAW